VDRSPQTQYLDRGDGTCRHFDADRNACGIYQDRPDICRVDRQYAQNYARQMSWNEFVVLNHGVCMALQALDLKPQCPT
jgi:hypothetical protein